MTPTMHTIQTIAECAILAAALYVFIRYSWLPMWRMKAKCDELDAAIQADTGDSCEWWTRRRSHRVE